MQNKKLHSDWQQKIAGKNLLGFVKYWLLGCQTVKWEIKKQNNQPPPAENKHYHITCTKTTVLLPF